MDRRKAKKRAALSRDRSNRLHLTLAQSIGGQILSGVYAPGTLLPNEAEWCTIHGASRTAVREAIKGLNAKGLLVSRPKVGSRVEPRERWNMLDRDVLRWHFSVADKQKLLISIQEVRRVIEPEVAALAAVKRSPAQLKALQEAMDGMTAAETPALMVAPDVAFHLALLAAANNELLAPFGVLVESALRNLFDYTSTRAHQPEDVLPLHQAIVAAIARGRPEAARRAVKLLLADTDATLQTAMAAARRPARPRKGR